MSRVRWTPRAREIGVYLAGLGVAVGFVACWFGLLAITGAVTR